MSAALLDVKDTLGRDLALAASHVLVRSEQLKALAHNLGGAVCELGKGADEGTVRDAVEAVNASVLRIISLAVECANESGRMLGAAFTREQLEQIGEE